MNAYDIAVVGGGASGLAAAISAKRVNKKASVAVTERLPKVGKKILATGNGRCNLSNTDLGRAYHGSCRDMPDNAGICVPDFFAGLGVLCEDDGSGRIYPRCRSAASVLDALRLECAKLGVEEICGFEVKKLEIGKAFTLRSDTDSITARSVILAGGGKSQSALGSNGSLLGICSDIGISVAPAFPALVPLKTDPALVKPLKGQRADANVTFSHNGKAVKSERGEVQFTDGLLSGICVFDLSYLYDMYGRGSELRLDLLPGMSAEEVTALLKDTRSVRADTAPEDYLSGIFTRPMGIYILKRALGRLPGKTREINDIAKVAGTIKALTFPVTGTAGFERSQVTGGGIVADELTERYELKKSPGMFACGELLDIYGDCGGYNLDFAFSSGILAGRYAASDLKKL
ncbi:MAG: aminoacetone oxidase family FAD-binding enzyme [Ruminiclostridium sp.]|nr:aminoacetone oxidase family FAD-binding enzyme [Ruminiclostridium sp.]